MRRYIGMRYTIRTFVVNIFHFEPHTVSSPLWQNLYPKRRPRTNLAKRRTKFSSGKYQCK